MLERCPRCGRHGYAPSDDWCYACGQPRPDWLTRILLGGTALFIIAMYLTTI